VQADTRPLTVGEWMITLLVLWIPLVNIVMYLIWALSETGNLNRKRFCQASIIWFLIFLGLGIAFAVLAAALGVMGTML
jgi:hypothetical protein